MINLIHTALQNSFSYTIYRSLVSELYNEGKVTGNTQSDALLHYTKLNISRMNRLDKTIKIPDEISSLLASVTTKYTLLTIAEGWCGDAAQILPIIEKMSNQSAQLDFKIVLRDENDALMNLFLTNGSKSIPKIIILETATNAVIASWGARPKPAQEVITSYKKEHGTVDEKAKINLQKWYLKDKGYTTMTEIIKLLK